MKLTLVAVGTRMPAWVQTGYEEYAKRLPRECALTLTEIKPEKRVGGKTAAQVMEAEKTRILAAVPQSARLIVLDERGENWTTARLSQNLNDWLGGGRDVAIVIGGADGLDPEVKQRAERLLQLSAMTLPHGMVRVLLAEQVYRAWSLLNNHPYHRE